MTKEQHVDLTPLQREEAKLRDREQALAKQQRRVNRERTQKEKKDATDERRKDSLIGRVVRKYTAAHAERLENGFSWPEWLIQLLDRELVHRTDRELFGLPPREGDGASRDGRATRGPNTTDFA